MELRPYQKILIDRIRSEFSAGVKRTLAVAPCGSGKTVLFCWMATESVKRGNHLWFVVHRQELKQQTIDSFERFGLSMDGITIEMVQTLANHMDKYEKPDMIIFDEAHFSKARTWWKIIEANPDVWYIGLTASPCRLDGKPLGDIYQSMVVGITTQELINMGMLSKYKYYAPTVTSLTGLKKRGGEYSAEECEKLLSKPAIFGDAIRYYNELSKGKQAIIYCSTIAHSEATAEAFRESGINAIHFDGNTPDKERKRIVADFKANKIDILVNVDLISVGFDCPEVTTVIFLRPTMSLALFIQQSGRALRPLEGKEAIIIDMVGNVHKFGMPSKDREWSLDSKITISEKCDPVIELKIRTCEKCYTVYDAKSLICPNCGHKNKPSREELRQLKEARLEEIKEIREETVRNERKKIEDCRNMAEVMSWCKLNGKKPGYGFYFCKSKGWMK